MAGKSKRKYSAKGARGQVSKKPKIIRNEEEEQCSKKTSCETREKFHEYLKKVLRVEMPDDFYEFYEFCKSIGSSNVHDALLEGFGLLLCGPFDLIQEHKSSEVSSDRDISSTDCVRNHLHSRYYYDPPEVMTVIRESSHKSGLHFGYFRDSPDELPSLVVSNKAEDGCVFTQCGDNMFAAVSGYAESLLKSTKDKSKRKVIEGLLGSLKTFAENCKQPLESVTMKMQKRNKKVVTKTFHKLGLVVPLDSNGVGYRPLHLTDNALKKVLRKICEAKNEEEKNKLYDDLHELITFVQFANDECDYGMGLELGTDLFCSGEEIFTKPILQLLPLAYSLLGRSLYGEIIEQHMQSREKPFIEKAKNEDRNADDNSGQPS